MARIESVAIGGYYATPPHLVARIAAPLARIAFDRPTDPERPWMTHNLRTHAGIVDPCAGDGAAAIELARLLSPKPEFIGTNVSLYTCELESTRSAALKKALKEINWHAEQDALACDAFRVVFKKNDGASLLFLNPPYDQDREFKRLEERFLHRFTHALAPNGVLVFLVPYYTLTASAETLALHYDSLRCFRFPAADFAAFKQVVVYARKREHARLRPDAGILALVDGWATGDPNHLDELPEVDARPLYELPIFQADAFHEWREQIVDTTALSTKYKLWHQTTRRGALDPIPGIAPVGAIRNALLRTYPVATPPRPAHIAAGIASGIFNGARIEPNDRKAKLPPLLIKGVFDREFRTIEEKRNKDGDKVGEVQVQQPVLRVTVLDLKSHTYTTLGKGVEETSASDVAKMTVADIVKHYGNALMDVMAKQCPVAYDPRRDADSIPLHTSPRKLFTAQAHAAKALVKLLGGPNASPAARRCKGANLLGEIGSGKTTVAITAARSVGATHILAVCPPHLLTSWQNEVKSVAPDMKAVVINDIEDVDRLPKRGSFIAILSREAAKLSHGWEGVSTGVCPRCGARIGAKPAELAKKRARCERTTLTPKSRTARLAKRLAYVLADYSNDPTLRTILDGRHDLRRIERPLEEKREWTGLPRDVADAILKKILAKKEGFGYGADSANSQIVLYTLLAAGCERAMINDTALQLFKADHHEIARKILFLLPESPKDKAHEEFAKLFSKASYGFNQWDGHDKELTAFAKGSTTGYNPRLQIDEETGVVEADGVAPGSLKAAEILLDKLISLGRWEESEPCGEPLFNAAPTPRRYDVASYILKRHRDSFDFLILDEGHEYANDSAAQSIAGHRLVGLGWPTILMTGTVMNGYASSLFTNMWSIDRSFREEFARDEERRFVDRYGYRKRVVEDRDEKGKLVEFGSTSDRVIRSERLAGDAPGVLPLFLLRHLLPVSVTLHKTDLAVDLPPCRFIRNDVTPTDAQQKNIGKMQKDLIARIRADQFEPEIAGKLFGQLAELPSYLDRCTRDTGNVEGSDRFEVCYPESVGGRHVTSAPLFSEREILPKEQWMLNIVKRELAQGRNVMVLTWHLNLLPRLQRLLGDDSIILYADKVPTAKRQDWIDKHVVKPKKRILIANPVAIQTGLNNLVHFASQVWMENPGCNAITFRQSVGRVDRIGQTKETRIYFPVYKDTLQEPLYDLLMKKIAVSTATDGLDPESALAAAGLSEDEYLTGLSIGKQLWAMIGGLGDEAAGSPRSKVTTRGRRVGT